jgi:Mrp family chromosome partitioning ATPase
MLGVAMGLGVLIAQHSLRQGAMTATALRDATGLPVFAHLPRSVDRSPRHLCKALNANGDGPLSAAVAGIRASLLTNANGQTPAVILVTSSISGEGKTIHAIALARSLAQSGKSVLYFGADAKAASPVLSGTQTTDLRDLMTADDNFADALVHDPQLRADVLLVSSSDGLAETCLADGFAPLMTDLRKRYDHIIIAARPVLTAPETQILAQHADAIIYAVRWAKTPLSVVNLGLRALEDAHAPAAGLILSKVNMRKLKRWGTTPVVGYCTTLLPA